MNQEQSSQLAVLKRFEPVIRYTAGERFFPIDVERYISQCSLWLQRVEEPPEQLVEQGELTVEKLISPRPYGFGTVYYLKFIEPPDLINYARYSLDQAVKKLVGRGDEIYFRGSKGRLSRVGYTSRLVDALFSISLLLRGRVTGDTAAAAALTYHQLQDQDERYTYYGRVYPSHGWIALQYWYLYPFNNWRSGFHGANDHEADWESITIYCFEDPDIPPDVPVEQRLYPRWIAGSVHDVDGDDLRRRWDDPELEIIKDTEGGQHPVIFAGAGSHACYYQKGEYLAEWEFPSLVPVANIFHRLQKFWVQTLNQGSGQISESRLTAFRIPFVDYARGDGVGIGAGEEKSWEAELISDETPWALNYRGLWGWYARDPIAGENAPAGPVYNRDGTVRQSWCDLLGWAGLSKEPAPPEVLTVIREQQAHWRREIRDLEAQIDSLNRTLQYLGVELDALVGLPHMEIAYREQLARVEASTDELLTLQRKVDDAHVRINALERYADQIADGYLGSMRDHIRFSHQPSPETNLRLAWFAEIFAAVSIGILLIGIVLLVVFARQYLIIGLAILLSTMVFAEAGFRRQLTRLISSVTIALAVTAALVMVYEFFWEIVVATVLAVGSYLIWENGRELWELYRP